MKLCLRHKKSSPLSKEWPELANPQRLKQMSGCQRLGWMGTGFLSFRVMTHSGTRQWWLLYNAVNVLSLIVDFTFVFYHDFKSVKKKSKRRKSDYWPFPGSVTFWRLFSRRNTVSLRNNKRILRRGPWGWGGLETRNGNPIEVRLISFAKGVYRFIWCSSKSWASLPLSYPFQGLEKLRSSSVKWLTPGHEVSEWKSWALIPGGLTSRSTPGTATIIDLCSVLSPYECNTVRFNSVKAFPSLPFLLSSVIACPTEISASEIVGLVKLLNTGSPARLCRVMTNHVQINLVPWRLYWVGGWREDVSSWPNAPSGEPVGPPDWFCYWWAWWPPLDRRLGGPHCGWPQPLPRNSEQGDSCT